VENCTAQLAEVGASCASEVAAQLAEVGASCASEVAARTEEMRAMYSGEITTLTEKVRVLTQWKTDNEHFEDLYRHETTSCRSDLDHLREEIIELRGISDKFDRRYSDLDAENRRLWWCVVIMLVFVFLLVTQEPLRKAGVRVIAWGNKTSTWCTGAAGHITLSVCSASQWAVNGVNRCANAIVHCVTSVANALVYAVFWWVNNSLLCYNTGIAMLSKFCFWASGKCRETAAWMFTNIIVQLAVYTCRDYIIGGEDITFPTDYIGIVRMAMAGGVYDSVVAVMLNPKMIKACTKTALALGMYLGGYEE